MEEMKKEYVKAINELARNCDDISLLDLVYQLMVKSMNK